MDLEVKEEKIESLIRELEDFHTGIHSFANFLVISSPGRLIPRILGIYGRV